MKIKQNSSNDSNENLNINNEISKINTNFEFSEISAEFSRFSDEDSSFFFQTKPKKQLQPEIKYIEDSPNKKYSRSAKISYSEKYHIAYIGIDNDRGCEIIWNEIEIKSINENNSKKLYNEIKRLKSLSKEDCINTIQDCWLTNDQNSIVFITDCFGMGTLRQYLQKIDRQKLKVIKTWIITLLRSLIFLHKSDLIYADLNCNRILFNGTLGTIAIRDLYVGSKITYECFNLKPIEIFQPNFMSPEMIFNKNINEKSDLYSLGMTIIEIITLEIPYCDCDSTSQIIQKIKCGKLPSQFYRILDENVKNFLLKMIAFNPNERLSVEMLLKDNFLKITKDDLRIIKVKSTKIKKKKMNENFTPDINFKNYLLMKQFKEDPYVEEKKALNDFNKNNYNNNENFFEENKINIVDENYSVHLKFFIKENDKLIEIKFVYNLLRDNIDNLMNEIKSEFNLSESNLNQIYQNLKKIFIYAKLTSDVQILPDNSF
jgi:serine/threonine protein kinase